MFEVKLTARARRELKALSRLHRRVVLEALRELRTDPFVVGKPLGRELTGRLTFRVGVYRIVYKVNKEDRTVLIFTTGYRGMVYSS